jgi:hypothetical protein
VIEPELGTIFNHADGTAVFTPEELGSGRVIATTLGLSAQVAITIVSGPTLDDAEWMQAMPRTTPAMREVTNESTRLHPHDGARRGCERMQAVPLDLCTRAVSSDIERVEVRPAQSNCRLYIIGAKAAGSATVTFTARDGTETLRVDVAAPPSPCARSVRRPDQAAATPIA